MAIHDYFYHYFAPGNLLKYCIQRVCFSVCLFVCLLAYLKKLDSQFSPNFLYMFLVAMAQSFFDGSVIRYVLLLLCMTSSVEGIGCCCFLSQTFRVNIFRNACEYSTEYICIISKRLGL